MNLEKNRSYNLAQWRKVCDSSEHQPPAKRGQTRRAGGYGQRNKEERPLTPPATTDSDAGTPEPEDEPMKRRPKFGRPLDDDGLEGFNYRIDDNEQYTPERCQELEKSYWKSLTFNNPMYGADLPGSLFDKSTKDWNVAHLDNILNDLGTILPGVNSAYLYLGMWKATFSWHVEDMDLYSINYIHFGAPKQWYSISQQDNQKFEKVMRDIFPNDARNCDQFMRHKTFGASPTRLAQHGLQVNKLVHYEKEFVITFPYGYHSGYNLGYNCAESVNFATEEWLEYGKVARKCQCVTDAVSIDVNDIIRRLNGEDLLTPPDSEDASDDNAERTTYSEFERLRRPKKKRRLNQLYATAQYKRISDKYHSRPSSSPVKPVIKKIRLSMPKAPCALCCRAPLYEDLLDAGNGRKVHRCCADFIPETSVVPGIDGAADHVVGIDNITKDRFALRCGLCKIPTGACFQCSSQKCVRAFHATCAYDAGVLVEKVDQTYGNTQPYHFMCRSHRPRRPVLELLEFDSTVMSSAANLQLGCHAQVQYANGHLFSGILRENRKTERSLLIEVGPDKEMVEVDYQWVLPGPKRAMYRPKLPQPTPPPVSPAIQFCDLPAPPTQTSTDVTINPVSSITQPLSNPYLVAQGFYKQAPAMTPPPMFKFTHPPTPQSLQPSQPVVEVIPTQPLQTPLPVVEIPSSTN